MRRKVMPSMDSIASLAMPMIAPPQAGAAAAPGAPEGGFAAALAQLFAPGPAPSPAAEDAAVETLPAEAALAMPAPTLPGMMPPIAPTPAVADAAGAPPGVAAAAPARGATTPGMTGAGAEALAPGAVASPPAPPVAPGQSGAPPPPRPVAGAASGAPALPVDGAPTASLPGVAEAPQPPAPGEPEGVPTEPATQAPSGLNAAERAREAVPETPPDAALAAGLVTPTVAMVATRPAAPFTPRQAAREGEAPSVVAAAATRPHPAEADAVFPPADPAATPPAAVRPAPVEGPSPGMAPPRPAVEAAAAPPTAEAPPPVSPQAATATQEARAPEAASPAAAPPPPASPARQLAPVLVSVAIAGGTSRLSVTLEPAELGRVEISVERTGDVAEVRVVAERPETLMLLQRDQRELDRALTQAGIGMDGRSLSFSLSDGGAGGFGSGRDGEGERMARGMRGGGTSTGGAEGTALAEAPARRLLSLIDLAV